MQPSLSQAVPHLNFNPFILNDDFLIKKTQILTYRSFFKGLKGTRDLRYFHLIFRRYYLYRMGKAFLKVCTFPRCNAETPSRAVPENDDIYAKCQCRHPISWMRSQ